MSQLNNISQREKNLILKMHKNLYASKPIPKETKLPISEQLSEIIGELEFQKKVHIHRLSRMNENEKVEYLNNVEETLLKIFKDNNTITENYNSRFRENLVESEVDPNQRIDRFNHFFLENLKIEFVRSNESILKEQFTAGKSDPISADKRLKVEGPFQLINGQNKILQASQNIPQSQSIVLNWILQNVTQYPILIDRIKPTQSYGVLDYDLEVKIGGKDEFKTTLNPNQRIALTYKIKNTGEGNQIDVSWGGEVGAFLQKGSGLPNYGGGENMYTPITLPPAKIKLNSWKPEKIGIGLAEAIAYIKEKGLEWVMENIRSALMSTVGAVIQMAISFTGVGNVATMVIWGVMAIYDAYQIFNNGAGVYWLNLIIDIICIVTAGWGVPIIRPYISKAAGAVGQGIKGVIGWMAKSGLAKELSGKVQLIIEGAGTLIGWLKQGADFMLNKMGIKWVGNLVNKISTSFDEIVKWIKAFPEWSANLVTKGGQVGAEGFVKLASLLPASMRTLVRTPQILAQKFAPETFERFVNLSADELGQFLGKTATKTGVEVARKTVTSAKEQTVQGVLDIIDNTLGTGWGDGYAAYLGGKKMFQWRGGKWQSVSQNFATQINPISNAGALTYTPDQSPNISRAGNIRLNPF